MFPWKRYDSWDEQLSGFYYKLYIFTLLRVFSISPRPTFKFSLLESLSSIAKLKSLNFDIMIIAAVLGDNVEDCWPQSFVLGLFQQATWIQKFNVCRYFILFAFALAYFTSVPWCVATT